jgi:redox-sensitive bicupin YhaK (pirin superfamily)
MTDIQMFTMFFTAGGRVEAPVPPGRNVFLYIVRGEAAVAGEAALEHHLIELEDDGDCVELSASSDAVVLFGHAVPFNEPVVAHGPFVMNTREEIREAMLDYQSGKFGGLR